VFDDDVIHAAWMEDDGLHLVVPVFPYCANSKPDFARRALLEGIKMVAFKVSDVHIDSELVPLFSEWMRKSRGHEASAEEGHRSLAQMATRLNNPIWTTNRPYGVMTGCPSSLYQLDFGFAADYGWTGSFTGYGSPMFDATKAVELVQMDMQNQAALVNVLYVDMINVFVRIAE